MRYTCFPDLNVSVRGYCALKEHASFLETYAKPFCIFLLIQPSTKKKKKPI